MFIAHRIQRSRRLSRFFYARRFSSILPTHALAFSTIYNRLYANKSPHEHEDNSGRLETETLTIVGKTIPYQFIINAINRHAKHLPGTVYVVFIHLILQVSVYTESKT